MKKKILSIVVTVLMVFAMMPMTMGMAYAADLGEGVLYVGGQDIVTAGGTVTGDNGQGSAILSYDGDGNPVLTLDNYKCESCPGDENSQYWSVIHYNGSAQLTIQLKGTNILKPADGSALVTGIYSRAQLVIKGEETGSLTTIGGASGVSSAGIYCRSGIQIESGNITTEGSNARNYSHGISAENITINGGAVTTRGHDAPTESYGIFTTAVTTAVEIYGGELVASSGSGKFSSGIFGHTTIGGDITRVEVVGNDQAIYGTVKNYVPGQGWDNTEETSDAAAIPINKDGTRLEYKKLVFPTVLNISITGNSDSVTYNGKEQSVSGYTVQYAFGDGEWTEKTPDGVSVALKEGYTAEIKRTNAGSYNMGLTAEYFDIDWGRYKQGEITVTDGVLTIKEQDPEPKPTPTPTPKPEPKPTPAKISGTLLTKMTAKGNSGLALSWSKVKGAEGYDIFFVRCGDNDSLKKVKTIKGNKTLKWTKKGLRKKTAYKAVVKAWVKKGGKKTYVGTSPAVHAYTSGGKKYFTNPESVAVNKPKVSLKKGKTFKIEASVTGLQKGKALIPDCHEPELRYISSNKKVAAVSKSGKIKAKGKGKCKVYVLAINGVRKAVAVTVK